MNRGVRAIAFLCAAAAWAAHAQSPDPLHSPECDAARVVPERALDDASARKAGAGETLTRARRAAIEACLGRDDAPRERSGAPYPSIAVRPPALEGPRLATVPPPAPPLDVGRAAAITTCDPGGCWDSEGRRLTIVGPVLVGPRGACTAQSGVVHCP
ncbi:hypothetical protein [Ramlibacter sp. PS4R-6]|uniref:hypothetical protein n=1 Tax=Ramlibacter sp. PS4R-6 TaxID=3133438 RepID=UPI0030AC8D56